MLLFCVDLHGQIFMVFLKKFQPGLRTCDKCCAYSCGQRARAASTQTFALAASNNRDPLKRLLCFVTMLYNSARQTFVIFSQTVFAMVIKRPYLILKVQCQTYGCI